LRCRFSDVITGVCVCVCVWYQGGPKFLGRAFGEPEFKFVEKHYQKPHLRYFDISFGKAPAGELLATFELIELDYSGFGEVTPVDPSMSLCLCPFVVVSIGDNNSDASLKGLRCHLKS